MMWLWVYILAAGCYAIIDTDMRNIRASRGSAGYVASFILCWAWPAWLVCDLCGFISKRREK